NSVLGMTASDTVAAASLSGVRQRLSWMCREWALTLKNGMPRKLFEATLVISSELHFRPPCLARICLTACAALLIVHGRKRWPSFPRPDRRGSNGLPQFCD